MKNSHLIGISAIILSIAIGYYFAIFLPAKEIREETLKNEKDAREELSKNEAECSLVEKRVYDSFLSLGNNSKTSNSVNHFNRKLQKCIVEILSFSANTEYTTRSTSVLDGKENKSLIWGSSNFGSNSKSAFFNYTTNADGEIITKDQFDKLENEYMAE